MPESRPARLVATALRCYPRRWRNRHGDEAAELAALLIRDGVPARSIAWSYLMGAACARLPTGSRRRLGAAMGTLLVAAGSLGVPLALSSSAPASAASVIRARSTDPAGAAGQLESLLHCSGLLGESVRQALPALDRLHVKIAWVTGSGKPSRWPVPDGRYYVAGGAAQSGASIAIRITAGKPAGSTAGGRHDQHC